MNLETIKIAARVFSESLLNSIESASYNGVKYANGQKAKEALIRSQTLIMNIHEAVKASFLKELTNNNATKEFTWKVFPELGSTSPELKVYGKLKGKDQDLVFLPCDLKGEIITEGPNQGETDKLGLVATNKSIVIGVRSQMSSVDKNFDTLMERSFAETLNLRLRAPKITMGEVYLIPIRELDDKAMEKNKVAFKSRNVNLSKFIRTFDALTGRKDLSIEEQYKYDATALLIVDLEKEPVEIIYEGKQLLDYGCDHKTVELFNNICATNFDKRMLINYKEWQR